MASLTIRTKVIRVTAAVVAVAALGVGGGAIWHDHQAAQGRERLARRVQALSCGKNSGPTMVTRDNPQRECVGITDGSYHFVPGHNALTTVEGKIAAEDVKVRARHGYVSVAYLLPISPKAESVMPLNSAIEQLEGAYAQVFAYNNQQKYPPIQLLIASNGDGAGQYAMTDKYIKDAVASQHLVAVAGIGVSLTQTEAAVNDLTGVSPRVPALQRIPVFASSITADIFDNVPNMVRVVPDNQDEVAALLDFARQSRWKDAVLVYDKKKGDTYSQTLLSHFRASWTDAGRAVTSYQAYDTSEYNTPGSGAVAIADNRLEGAAAEICQAAPDVVLFAGRHGELGRLIHWFSDRCSTQPLTVVTGDDATNLSATALSDLKQTKVTLYYAANANPHEWNGGSGAVYSAGRQGFGDFSKQFLADFPVRSMRDGNAMMGWDATLTAATAINLAGPKHCTVAAVASEIDELQDPDAVKGATGQIAFSADPASLDRSNPQKKGVPILSVGSSGGVSFRTLEWPEGEPTEAP
jgi:hypothetical protein